jgi:hypothetical protein
MTKSPKGRIKSGKNLAVTEISDLERVKTLLVLLHGFKQHHPDERTFSWKPEVMLSPLRDQFEMERVFEILRKETGGNVQAKYEVAEVFSEATGQLLGMQRKTVLFRIKNDKKLAEDYKRILVKKEKEPGNTIKKVEILESRASDKLIVFINEDYRNERITPKKEDRYWAALLRITKERSISVSDARSIVDFFNTNRKNMLYSRSRYSLTEILAKEDGVVSALIPMKIITEKAIAQRRNRLSA